MHSDPTIGLHKSSMWVENVVQKFQEVAVPQQFDLLSVDTDFADFWLLREILQAGYSPRVIIVEVNVAPGPFASFTVPLERAKAHDMWHGNRWFGSSILALSKLVHAFGYQLLYVEAKVVNAIFVKSSEINNIDLARVAWQRQLFEGLGYGIAHKPDDENRPFVHICQRLPCNSSNDW
uniref:Methyltransferase FkbM domain-containing protein n=1 Tax=Plectus sambesii TaxID=2011161 RepID=A0A914UML6_9BILA